MAKEAAPVVATEPVVNDAPIVQEGQQQPLRPPEYPKPTTDQEEEFRGDEGEEDEDEDDSEDESEDEQPRDDQGRFQPKGQTLRDRLAAEAREKLAERQRADRLEAMLAQQQALLAKQLGVDPQGQQPQPEAEGPPNPDNYQAGQFDPQYIADMARYQVREEIIQHERQRAAYENHKRQQDYLITAEQQYAQAVPDYLDAKQTLLSDPAIANHPGIGQAIVSSQRPAELIYALGKNPQVAANIARMNPVQAAMTLGKIEAMIEAQVSQPQEKPAVKNPPAPIKPIGGRASAGNSDPGMAKTYAEFIAIREAQEKKRMGR
jgi:hypothetical protein